MLASTAGPSNWNTSTNSDVPDTQPDERYVCSYDGCNKLFSKPHKLRFVHLQLKAFTKICQKKLTRLDCRKHEKTHNPLVNCPAATATTPCKHKTAERRDMDRHLWVEHKRYAERHNIDNPGDKCDQCGTWFTRRYNLQRHLNEGRCRPGGEMAEEEDEDGQ